NAVSSSVIASVPSPRRPSTTKIRASAAINATAPCTSSLSTASSSCAIGDSLTGSQCDESSRRSPPGGGSAGWLGGRLAVRRRRNGARQRSPQLDGGVLAVMLDLERLALREYVSRPVGTDLDEQPSSAEADPERQPGECLGQPGLEAEEAVLVANAAQSCDRGDIGSGERRDVESVACVVL